MGEPDDREDFGHHFYYSRRQGAGAVPPAYGTTDFGTRSGYDNEDVADLECGGADRRPKMARNTSSSSTTPPLMLVNEPYRESKQDPLYNIRINAFTRQISERDLRV